jgi:Tol biopolymer transport system component
MHRVRILFVVALVVAASGCAFVTRASVSSNGTEANGDSGLPTLNGDGRYVAFTSAANNLVAGDTNNAPDVFVRDNSAGTTERVSVTSGGAQAHGASSSPAISLDGRYVAFTSSAPDLVAGDTNGTTDVFVRDRAAGTTTRVSVMPDGSQDTVDASAPSITFDGRYVVWVQAHSATTFDVIERDLETSTSVFIASDSPYQGARISPDGNVVALVGDCSNTCTKQLAWWQRPDSGSSTVLPLGTPGLLPDPTGALAVGGFAGRYIVFHATPASPSGPPTGLYLIDLVNRAVEPVSVSTTDGTEVDGTDPSMSIDGRYVAFTTSASGLDVLAPPADTNGVTDVYVRDRVDKFTRRVSTSAMGDQLTSPSSNPSMSGDGRYVAFTSSDAGVVSSDTNGAADVFVKYAHTPAVLEVNDAAPPYPLPRGTTNAAIIIGGADFMPGATVAFGSGVTVSKVDYYSTGIVVATVSVDPNATTGSRDVVVINNSSAAGANSGAAGVCSACVTIT